MSTLYIVATPIGNLEDITLRALRILKEADLVVCEDTRRTAVLLDHYKIKKPLISYHQHSKLEKIEKIIGLLKSGKNIALVTDAGTPGIADPAGILIAEALKHTIIVEPIPGPSVLTALLSASGEDTQRFLFLGYLPKKKGRQTLWGFLKKSDYPIVFFESPYRIQKTLKELLEVSGDRKIIVGRELTKKFETIYRGKISEIIKEIRPQGELVIFISKEKREPKGT